MKLYHTTSLNIAKDIVTQGVFKTGCSEGGDKSVNACIKMIDYKDFNLCMAEKHGAILVIECSAPHRQHDGKPPFLSDFLLEEEHYSLQKFTFRASNEEISRKHLRLLKVEVDENASLFEKMRLRKINSKIPKNGLCLYVCNCLA